MSKAEVQIDDKSNKVLVYKFIGPTLKLISTLATSVFGKSGASHATGIVPDPGAVAGTTKYLREDATWQVPPGGSGGGNDILPWLGW